MSSSGLYLYTLSHVGRRAVDTTDSPTSESLRFVAIGDKKSLETESRRVGGLKQSGDRAGGKGKIWSRALNSKSQAKARLYAYSTYADNTDAWELGKS